MTSDKDLTIPYNTNLMMDSMAFMGILKPEMTKAVFFDPQYRGVLDKLAYGNEGERQKKRAELQQMTDGFINSVISEIYRVLMPSGYLFFWTDKFYVVEGVIQKFKELEKLKPVDMIIWDKQRIGMGYRSRRKSEHLIIFQKEPVKAKATWTDHSIPDVWSEKNMSNKEFPHIKPIGLIKKLIGAVTEMGDIVVDPCAGSFRVKDACIEMDRLFLGCDIETGKRVPVK